MCKTSENNELVQRDPPKPVKVEESDYEAVGSGFPFIKKKLFTKEDPLYLHKLLGVAALYSFYYRYCVRLPRTGNLGFTGSALDYATILLHLALSSSSLIFHVLRKRIVNRPMIIWHEYRLHTILFTSRGCVGFVLEQLAVWETLGAIEKRIVLFVLIMGHHVAVDRITKKHGTPDVTTVRNTPGRPEFTDLALGLRFYSFFQIVGTGCLLIPSERIGDIGWNSFIAIQSSAFLMTLFKKGLIRWYTHAVVYTGCIWICLGYMLYSVHQPFFIVSVLCVFVLRVNRFNKYHLWTLYTLASCVAIKYGLMPY